jgi:NtrC-family two-component system sensor histidine kinase KinB
MALSVKKKIWLGTLFLFVLLILTGGAGIYFTNILKQETKTVLQDNYESLYYCHGMQKQLDSFTIDREGTIKKFEDFLEQQEDNTTEQGEAAATKEVRKNFELLKIADTSAIARSGINKSLHTILSLNMDAMQYKNVKAQKAASNAVTIIIVLGAIIFLIGFTFLINFPSIVTEPINAITAGIQEIANKNYKQRIYIDNKDEFGQLAAAFNQMAERLEYFESSNLNKLMFEKARAEAVINSLKDASIGVGKDGKILFANSQALQLLGLDVKDVVGHLSKEVVNRNDLFSFLINSEATAPFKIVVANRENYFIKEVIEVEDNKVIVLKNITSFKELDAAKTNFIATISHELKTPLASSDLSLKLLEDKRVGSLTEDQQDLILNLKQDNQRMLKILSELLNMSQVEAGKIALNIKQVNAKDIVEATVATIASSAKDKNINITTAIQKGVPILQADMDKTTWVLNNFLSNAVKFAPPNSVVELSVEIVNSNIVFSVSDEGPGVDIAYRTKVFDRYFQIPGNKSKGTGLGLSISKDFIDAQGGDIWVEGRPGSGSVFKFSLPVA